MIVKAKSVLMLSNEGAEKGAKNDMHKSLTEDDIGDAAGAPELK